MIVKGLTLLVLATLLVGLDALRLANPNRPGRCPRTRSLYRSTSGRRHGCWFRSHSNGPICQRDSQCPRFQKCCGCPRKCIEPLPEAPKPGICPPVPPTLPEVCERTLPPFECRTDAHCRGGDKCCPTMCGGQKCKPGVAQQPPPPPPPPPCQPLPPTRPETCQMITVVRECETDSSCGPNGRCCPWICLGTRCTFGETTPQPTTQPPQNPLPPQNPRCPPPSFPPICRVSLVAHQCTYDEDCSNGQICCRAHCNARQCVNKQLTPSPRCPFTPTNPLPDFCAARASIPGCRVDSDCNRGRCCPDECGVPMCTRRSVY